VIGGHPPPVRSSALRAYPGRMDRDKLPSPAMLLVGGVVALVVALVVIRWVLRTLFFFGKVALVVIVIAAVVSWIGRLGAKSGKQPPK
jgi:undecaprenyl pyrophosphate phosphatase UppP